MTAKQLEKLCAEEDGEEGGDELDELFKEALADKEDDDDDEYEDVTDDEVGSPSPFQVTSPGLQIGPIPGNSSFWFCRTLEFFA